MGFMSISAHDLQARPIPSRVPHLGDVVRVRARRHLVEEVVASDRTGTQTLVRLSCIDDDSQGTALNVLWEREIHAEVIQESAWTDLGQLSGYVGKICSSE